MLRFPEQSLIIAASPDTILEALKRLETLLPKIVPSVVMKVHKIQGDGGAGTIVQYVYASEFAEGRALKMTTEVFDEVNYVFHFDLQLERDSRYSSFKLHVQLFPGLLEGTTRSQWTFIYEPDYAPPPLDIIATAHPCIVAFSTYLHEFQSSSSAGAESAESLAETIPFVRTELAESLSETIPSAGTEPAESLTEIIPSVSIKGIDSLDGTIPSASTEVAESYRNNPSAGTRPAENLTETI